MEKLPFKDGDRLQSETISGLLEFSGPKTPLHFPTYLAGRKFTEKFGGAVGLAKVEVGWCGEHADLSPAVLSSNESLEGPPVFRICVQGLWEKGGGEGILTSKRVPVLNVTSQDKFPELFPICSTHFYSLW